jgi:glycosyltransferase involved in cell wall biosynthesis
MIILIPAYQPDRKLIDLVSSIDAAAPGVVVLVVDDGSGPDYRSVFAAVHRRGHRVVGYDTNQGKGFALKTGFALIAREFPGQDVVCADCDGQHAVGDILRVVQRVRTGGTAMVLGTRSFTGDVPARSRVGNLMTRWLFRLSTGHWIDDTQTGLRGYPSSMLGWLGTIGGNRYEYELNILLEACQTGRAIETEEIATIYLAANASSHFRPLADSVRIYAPLLKFILSSLAAFVIDAVALLVLTGITGSLLFSVIGARVLSSATNFLVNRRAVFVHGRDRPVGVAALGYFTLVIILVAVNYLSLLLLMTLQVPLLPAKVITEVTLFVVGYAVQSRFLFAGRKAAPASGSVATGGVRTGESTGAGTR